MGSHQLTSLHVVVREWARHPLQNNDQRHQSVVTNARTAEEPDFVEDGRAAALLAYCAR